VIHKATLSRGFRDTLFGFSGVSNHDTSGKMEDTSLENEQGIRYDTSMVRLGYFAFTFLALTSAAFLEHAKAIKARAEVEQIMMASELFEEEYGGYPDQETWMLDLTADANSTLNTKQKVFIDLSNEEFQDPWGEAYQYFLVDVDGKSIPRTYSTGRDRTTATNGNDPDDIPSWREFDDIREAYPTAVPVHPFELLVWLILLYVILRWIFLRWMRRKKTP